MTWTYGDKLKDARVQAGLTQREAADLVGVRERSWGAWERGTNDPSLDNLRMIVERLKVPPELVGYDAPRGWELVPADWIAAKFDEILLELRNQRPA